MQIFVLISFEESSRSALHEILSKSEKLVISRVELESYFGSVNRLPDLCLNMATEFLKGCSSSSLMWTKNRAKLPRKTCNASPTKTSRNFTCSCHVENHPPSVIADFFSKEAKLKMVPEFPWLLLMGVLLPTRCRGTMCDESLSSKMKLMKRCLS